MVDESTTSNGEEGNPPVNTLAPREKEEISTLQSGHDPIAAVDEAVVSATNGDERRADDVAVSMDFQPLEQPSSAAVELVAESPVDSSSTSDQMESCGADAVNGYDDPSSVSDTSNVRGRLEGEEGDPQSTISGASISSSSSVSAPAKKSKKKKGTFMEI